MHPEHLRHPVPRQQSDHKDHKKTIKTQPIAFGVSFNLALQSQSNWSGFDGTWLKRRGEVDNRFSFEIGGMTLQMQ